MSDESAEDCQVCVYDEHGIVTSQCDECKLVVDKAINFLIAAQAMNTPRDRWGNS